MKSETHEHTTSTSAPPSCRRLTARQAFCRRDPVPGFVQLPCIEHIQ
jgi:hypothetical protein